jgi:hypothetical protein
MLRQKKERRCQMARGRKSVSVGARVKIVPHHWLRGLEEGSVIDYQSHARNNWLVMFDHCYPGGGIEGDKLWLDESQFLEVDSSEGTIEERDCADVPAVLNTWGLH